MLLKEFMVEADLDDVAMAEKIGGLSPDMVKKLRFRMRGPSVRVAARIEEISLGKVRAPDLLPLKQIRAADEGIAP